LIPDPQHRDEWRSGIAVISIARPRSDIDLSGHAAIVCALRFRMAGVGSDSIRWKMATVAS